MVIHRLHPKEDEVHAILYDDCERCDQHVNNLLDLCITLDRDNIRELWQEMLVVEEMNNGYRDYYRTSNEAKACGFLYRLKNVAQTNLGLEDPWNSTSW